VTDRGLSETRATPDRLRTTRLAPAGRHTRYMLAAYLRHVFIVTAGLLAIALTIDLWPQLQKVEATVTSTDPLATLWAILRFSGLRAPDLIIPFVPFATFLGVVWTEIALTQSRERMLVWNSGRSPVQCLPPVVALGLLLGAADFTLDAYLRPAAMEVQMRERLGTRGELFDRTRTEDSRWIALDRGRRGLVRGQIVYGPPVALRDVTIYKLDGRGHLQEADTAVLATPVGKDNLWVLHDGRFWIPRQVPAADEGAAFGTSQSDAEMQTAFVQRTISLDLNQLWLNNRGIYPQYLPMGVLSALARTRGGAFPVEAYRTRLQVKYSELVLPGAMALLASCLSMLLFVYRVSAPAIVGTLLAGYLAHFGTKAMLLMGENRYINAYVAGWLVPVGLAYAIWEVLRVIERRRRNPARAINDPGSSEGIEDASLRWTPDELELGQEEV
jgi:lipopolysaccharide export system permease protein